jgi:uncharacterized protein YukE
MQVVPGQVYQAAALGRAHHEGLAGVYHSTLSQAWDAQPRWVGRSGAAFWALLGRWQRDAAEHHRLLNDHHDGLHTAACAVVGTDQTNGHTLARVDDTDTG